MEYLSSGGVDCTHKDFKELRYSDSLTKFNCNGKNSTSNGMITHGFKLKSAYENGLMPYTNYTFDFKVIVLMERICGGGLCCLLHEQSTIDSNGQFLRLFGEGKSKA